MPASFSSSLAARATSICGTRNRTPRKESGGRSGPSQRRCPAFRSPSTCPGSRQMHRCTLVRSVHHGVSGAHSAAAYLALTGHDRGDRPATPTPADHPALGSVLAHRRPPAGPTLPYILLPHAVLDGGRDAVPGFGGGFLGPTYDPFLLLGDPNGGRLEVPGLDPVPHVPPARLDARFGLLRRLDGPAFTGGSAAALDSLRSRARSMLDERGVRWALRVGEEPEATREAYGRNLYGQSVLLARRLVEAGTRLVAVNLGRDPQDMTWDHHREIFPALRTTRLPVLDACVSSLIADLADRGLLERTLVVVAGEFGRTPRVNVAAGRDHWSGCYSVLLAGGGIVAGYAHGASDRLGAEPRSDAVGPADVLATLYACLGIPPDSELRDRQGRPFPLAPGGRPIPQLLG